MGIMIIIYHYRAYGAFILGDTLLMSLMKLSPTGSYLFNGFFTPDVECSDRRISSKVAQCVGPILLYLAGYDYDFIKKQMTRIEAKSSLATHHRQWKPHSVILSLIEKGKVDPAFYRTLKAVNLLMRWSLGTTTGRIVRSLHGLASGVAGHLAITTMVYGLTLQAMRNYRAAHDLDEDTYDAGYMAEYFSKMGFVFKQETVGVVNTSDCAEFCAFTMEAWHELEGIIGHPLVYPPEKGSCFCAPGKTCFVVP